MNDQIRTILTKFPFLSFGTMNETSYLGIIQNSDAQLVSMYLLDMIPTGARDDFLACGEDWWWGSNRQVPINIFLKTRFRKYRPFLRHFARKDFVIEAGPAVSLHEMIARRVRKRQITLVRRSPEV